MTVQEETTNESVAVEQPSNILVDWSLIRFVPDPVTAEVVNLGIVIYWEDQEPEVCFGAYQERLSALMGCRYSPSATTKEVELFERSVMESGTDAVTARIYQVSSRRRVKRGDRTWVDRVLNEMVPTHV